MIINRLNFFIVKHKIGVNIILFDNLGYSKHCY